MLVALSMAHVNAHSQQIVSVEFVENISIGIGQLLLVTLGVNISLDTGVDLYRITYTTTGTDMSPDTASGLLMLPDIIDRELPILVYQHGTTDGRSDVPSNLDGGYQLGAIFAGKGMAVIAPDYLGLGTSRGFHPYVHAETEATAALDMLIAVHSYMQEQEIAWNEQLFVTGYSQGGHAAMAFHKYVQENVPELFTVDASLPMSGPYSVSSVMRDLAFRDEPYGFPAYLVYSTRGIKEILPSLYEDESEVFKDPFLNDINTFIDSGDGLFDMNERIVQTLVAQFGSSVPKQIFVDSVLNVFEMDEDHPFNMALKESDVVDWTPEAPVLMLYCPTDDQVPFTNSILADSVMNANGAENVSSMDVSGGANLDHTDCIVPALNVGIPWLLSFVDAPTSTVDLQTSEVLIFPNPVDNGNVRIESEESIESIALFDLDGRMILERQPGQARFQLNLSGLQRGMYVLRIETGESQSSHKVIIL